MPPNPPQGHRYVPREDWKPPPSEEGASQQTGKLYAHFSVETKKMEAAVQAYAERCKRNGFTPTEEDVLEVMKPFIRIGGMPLKEPAP